MSFVIFLLLLVRRTWHFSKQLLTVWSFLSKATPGSFLKRHRGEVCSQQLPHKGQGWACLISSGNKIAKVTSVQCSTGRQGPPSAGWQGVCAAGLDRDRLEASRAAEASWCTSGPGHLWLIGMAVDSRGCGYSFIPLGKGWEWLLRWLCCSSEVFRSPTVMACHEALVLGLLVTP